MVCSAEASFDGSTDQVSTVSTTPILKVPFRAISSQFNDFLSRYGIESACDAWRTKAPTPGVLADISHDEKWKIIAFGRTVRVAGLARPKTLQYILEGHQRVSSLSAYNTV